MKQNSVELTKRSVLSTMRKRFASGLSSFRWQLGLKFALMTSAIAWLAYSRWISEATRPPKPMGSTPSSF